MKQKCLFHRFLRATHLKLIKINESTRRDGKGEVCGRLTDSDLQRQNKYGGGWKDEGEERAQNFAYLLLFVHE